MLIMKKGLCKINFQSVAEFTEIFIQYVQELKIK